MIMIKRKLSASSTSPPFRLADTRYSVIEYRCDVAMKLRLAMRFYSSLAKRGGGGAFSLTVTRRSSPIALSRRDFGKKNASGSKRRKKEKKKVDNSDTWNFFPLRNATISCQNSAVNSWQRLRAATVKTRHGRRRTNQRTTRSGGMKIAAKPAPLDRRRRRYRRDRTSAPRPDDLIE